MSSAVLFLAIIAIWACVLIPRLLRREPPRGTVTGHDPAVPDVGASDAELAEATAAAADGADAGAVAGGYAGRDAGLRPLTAGESRRRTLAARRRLLGMLVVLEIAATALAVLALVAMWVVIPPTLMLAGYLLLLREASRADAEHAQWEAEAAARAAEARARERRARARTARHAASVPAESPAEALAARFAAAPVAADYEESGRDFAPGLAGKYTTSHEDYEYPEPRQRAVGD